MYKTEFIVKRFHLVLAGLWLVLGTSLGNIRLPAIFSDNMVLQRGMRVPVWGWADPGEPVTVTIGGHTGEGVTDKQGRWKLYIGPLDAGGPFEFTAAGKDTLTLHNVLVGEVWVCSGQSNMAMEVEYCLNAKQEISSANYPQIREFQVKRSKSLKPLDDVEPVDNPQLAWLNTWEICSPSTVGHFSGTGYFFGLNLYKKLHIPVGLIHLSWGGTTAEAWTPHDTLESDPKLSVILQHWPDYNNDEEWLREEYAKYVKDVNQARKEGHTEPLYFNEPSVLYNGIIAPVVNYGIRGVAWYQGESNAYRAYQYRSLLPALITKWRNKWGEGNFPFLIVQLANYHFEPQVFPELREAQNMALCLPGTALVVTIDIGDSADIHPKNKQEVGRRLFLAAEKLAYGEKILCTGPVFQSMLVRADTCELTFTHTGDGLSTSDQRPLNGFSIAGPDREFHVAQATIKGNTVIVHSTEVPHPVAVRYAWANNPGGCNLANKKDHQPYLPASPFRTDDWPGITRDRF